MIGVFLCVAAGLATAQGAGAATLNPDGTGGVYWNSQDNGAGHTVDIERTSAIFGGGFTGYSIQVSNENTVVDAATGCTPAGDQPAGTYIQCPTSINRITIDLYHQNDVVRNSFCPSGVFCLGQSITDIPVTLIGRGGSDSLEGGSGADTLNGDSSDSDAGDDTLIGGGGTDTFFARAGNDTVTPGPGDDGVIDGGLGTDRISYDDGRSAGVNVTLANSATQNDGGPDDGAAGSREALQNFENATGTNAADTIDSGSSGTTPHSISGLNGNDFLLGSDGVDVLSGGIGNDTLQGRDGADDLFGDDGIDTTSYSERTARVVVNLAAAGNDDGNSADGGAGSRDESISIENAIGSDAGDDLTALAAGSALSGRGGADKLIGAGGPDFLTGGAGADTLTGAGGTDELQGGTENDLIDGGDSAAGQRDVADYTDHTGGVNVTLINSAVANDGNAEDGAARDRVINVEEVLGTAQNDTLIGDSSDERFAGNAGDDLIRPAQGKDIVSGGAGAGDTYDNSDRTGTVQASLDGVENEIDGDVIGTTMERIIGGEANDLLSTNVGLSELRGGPGNDRLTANVGGAFLRGEGGRDNLTGGPGTDTLDGGDENDTLNGLGGVDTFFGGNGDDNVTADDGIGEAVDCGAGTDFAATDALDRRAGCELPTNPPAQQPPGNQPPPPGGGGGDDEPDLRFMAVTVGYDFFPRHPKRTTRFARFRVDSVPRGSKVVAKCVNQRNKKCKGKLGKSFTKRNARGLVALKVFNKKKFPAGSRLEVMITNPKFVSQIKMVTVRRNASPKISTRCQRPGSKRRTACGG